MRSINTVGCPTMTVEMIDRHVTPEGDVEYSTIEVEVLEGVTLEGAYILPGDFDHNGRIIL